MNNAIKTQILDTIRQYDRVIITRHIKPDCDAVGSTLGLRQILRLSFPEKQILLINDDYADYAAFLGDEDKAIDDSLYADSLAIVLDTGNCERISNQKYKLCRRVIKIDHHVDIKPYGDLFWVEDQRSSVCEMIVDFYSSLAKELKIDKYAAQCLYAGMVTDSGRFRFSSVSGQTLRCAATLLDLGVDTESLFAHLYLDDFAYFKYKAAVYKKLRLTEHGVAWLYVSEKMQAEFGLTNEQACAAVSLMDSIKNSIIWLAFIENPGGGIRVRLRSRFVTVNKLAERYGGGGHECAAGATVTDRKQMNALIKDADALIKQYKENNTGWL